jgi:hypothetical protein
LPHARQRLAEQRDDLQTVPSECVFTEIHCVDWNDAAIEKFAQ